MAGQLKEPRAGGWNAESAPSVPSHVSLSYLKMLEANCSPVQSKVRIGGQSSGSNDQDGGKEYPCPQASVDRGLHTEREGGLLKAGASSGEECLLEPTSFLLA